MVDEGFSAEERAAMKERARELKTAKNRQDAEKDVLTTIEQMGDTDRSIAEKLYALLKQTAPDLAPKNWYGQPAFSQDGKVIVFFQAAGKFGTRYATLGFSEQANLDEGVMWPTSFALTEWTPAVEQQITALVRKALGKS